MFQTLTRILRGNTANALSAKFDWKSFSLSRSPLLPTQWNIPHGPVEFGCFPVDRTLRGRAPTWKSPFSFCQARRARQPVQTRSFFSTVYSIHVYIAPARARVKKGSGLYSSKKIEGKSFLGREREKEMIARGAGRERRVHASRFNYARLFFCRTRARSPVCSGCTMGI